MRPAGVRQTRNLHWRLDNAGLLILVVYAAYVFRYRRLPPELRPSRLYDCLLWTSFVSISAVGLLAIVKLFP